MEYCKSCDQWVEPREVNHGFSEMGHVYNDYAYYCPRCGDETDEHGPHCYYCGRELSLAEDEYYEHLEGMDNTVLVCAECFDKEVMENV